MINVFLTVLEFYLSSSHRGGSSKMLVDSSAWNQIGLPALSHTIYKSSRFKMKSLFTSWWQHHCVTSPGCVTPCAALTRSFLPTEQVIKQGKLMLRAVTSRWDGSDNTFSKQLCSPKLPWDCSCLKGIQCKETLPDVLMHSTSYQGATVLKKWNNLKLRWPQNGNITKASYEVTMLIA